MRTVEGLIDEAVRKCSSAADLARRIGVHRSEISDLKNGRRPMTPELVALLCDLLDLSGEECQRLAALAVVGNPKNAKVREVLRRAFFGCWATGAVASFALLWAPSDAQAVIDDAIKVQSTAPSATDRALSAYTLSRTALRKALSRAMARLRRLTGYPGSHPTARAPHTPICAVCQARSPT